MKKGFNFFIVLAVLMTATMNSCKKDEMDVNLKDNTENTFAIKVTDNRTGDVIAGAVVKDSEGNTVATTSEAGTAIYTKKAGDQLIYTLEATGYASMWCNGESVQMYKLGTKLSGIATYTDKFGNLNVVPSGSDVTVSILGDFIQKVYTVKAGANGAFEFSSLPDGAYFEFFPITIGSDKYNVQNYWGTIGETGAISIRYSFISSNELPFAVIACPGRVTATGNIVIKFNKAVDTESGDFSTYDNYNYEWISNDGGSWSADKKTLTLKPTTSWGNTGDYFYFAYEFYTPLSNGEREYVSNWGNIQIIE